MPDTDGVLVEIAGWAGGALVLAAYALLSMRRLSGESPAFQWMNGAGAAGLIVNGIANRAYPSVAVNVVWIAIGAVALYRRRAIVADRDWRRRWDSNPR